MAFVISDGYAVTPAAEDFLRQYSGLEISGESSANPLVLSGRVAARGVDPGWCDAYARALGVVLSPVGQYSNMTVYIDQSGELWGGFDEDYGRIGSLLDLIHETFIGPPKPFDRQLD